jgi:hypothetical protein
MSLAARLNDHAVPKSKQAEIRKCDNTFFFLKQELYYKQD